ncbi:MAG: 23S rRNA (guanosine(2251)-2'-O)-methyltransferase RlmB [Clostridiales bacterium]|jgi:23S rRNA (guanosine2251-2'-O)-methyltransferase|nr:23S rRNA (guanosine(2251)-2'-O)-methyltransferase RlmB [Clostridiales bacterium]
MRDRNKDEKKGRRPILNTQFLKKYSKNEAPKKTIRAKKNNPAEAKIEEAPEETNLQLEGRNAVLEALNNDKDIDKIFIKKSDSGTVEGTLKVIFAKAKDRGVVVIEAAKAKLDEMSQSGNHQGVIALCPPIEYVEISVILENAKNKNETPFVLVLDGITDPHNVGAIIRSCDACGVHGVIIPKRRAATITGIVSKTSAGAIEHVPIAKVTNINSAIEELKAAGLWVGCADQDGQVCYNSNLTGPVAIVIGNEGTGVSRLVKENCDFVSSIPMYGKIGSLNASVAASVMMYEVIRQRNFMVK